MIDHGQGSARQEWKHHWPVVLAAAAGTSLGAIPSYALGLFVHPLEEAFGWSRASISAAITIYAAVGVLGAPAAGHVLDKVGSRRFALVGVTCISLLFASLAFITASIWSWWAVWFLLGLAGLGIKPAVWTKAVTSFFTAGRGVAIAVMLCGTGVATSVLPAISNKLIDSFGWRGGFAALGLGVGAIVLPLVWLFLFDAVDKDAKSAKIAMAKVVDRAEHSRSLPGWSAAEGLRRRQLYQIALAALIATGVITGFVVHIVPMLTLSGLSRGEAVGVVSLIGILSIMTRLTVGYVFDRIAHPIVGALSIAAPAIPALVLLTFDPGFATAVCAVVALGIAAGGEYDAVIYLSSRYFGLRALGFLFGIVVSALLAGVGLGPIIAGHIFDLTGSYDMFLLGAIPASLLAGGLIALLGPYPKHEAPIMAAA